MYTWLLDKNMLDDYEDGSTGFKGLFYSSERKEVNKDLVMKVLDIVMDSRIALSRNLYNPHKIGNNAAEVFRQQLEARMKEDEELLNNKDMVFAIFDWFLRYETIENGCDGMEDVSIASYTDWTDWGDGSLLNFKLGYKSLPHWFSNQIPSKKWIYLNRQVINIEISNSSSNGDSPIRVKYMHTKNNKQSSKMTDFAIIECDHVIMTASLGFLKQNHETLFKPPLPDLKRQLIESIGFGTVNKIILQFEKPFWSDEHGVKLIWNQKDRAKFPSWVQDIIAFDTVRRQPNLLIGWIGGQGAKLMEKESDSEIAKTCLRLFEQFLPPSSAKPTRLIGCICSRWNSNPFVCGSYSYLSMASFEKHVEKLHEPIYNSANELGKLSPSSAQRVPRILFAGEATAGELYSTTHGAIISGWREADRLSDFLSNDMLNINQAGSRQSG